MSKMLSQLQRRRPQTWTQRVIYIARRADHDQLVNAWKATLCHHPMLRTIPYDLPNEEYGCLEIDPTRLALNAYSLCFEGTIVSGTAPYAPESTLKNPSSSVPHSSMNGQI